MSAVAILARIRRPDQLSRGLAQEIQLVERADDPMLYVERKVYLTAIRTVRAGIFGPGKVLCGSCGSVAKCRC
jgi:hypothetical protein